MRLSSQGRLAAIGPVTSLAVIQQFGRCRSESGRCAETANVAVLSPWELRALGPRAMISCRVGGKIRLLIDASGFGGWEDIAAFENHAGFVKSHQQKVDRIAVVVAHDWQHWLVGAVRVFMHPQIRAYDKGRESEALRWIVG
jgi:hypothetical protein